MRAQLLLCLQHSLIDSLMVARVKVIMIELTMAKAPRANTVLDWLPGLAGQSLSHVHVVYLTSLIWSIEEECEG